MPTARRPSRRRRSAGRWGSPRGPPRRGSAGPGAAARRDRPRRRRRGTGSARQPAARGLARARSGARSPATARTPMSRRRRAGRPRDEPAPDDHDAKPRFRRPDQPEHGLYVMIVWSLPGPGRRAPPAPEWDSVLPAEQRRRDRGGDPVTQGAGGTTDAAQKPGPEGGVPIHPPAARGYPPGLRPTTARP